MGIRGVLIALVCGLWVALLTIAHPASAEPRIALVIANQRYTQPGAKLTNTHRDGDLVKAALEKVGFKVWVVRDTANEGAMLKAISDHTQRLAAAGPDAVGFLYYSGHGAADRTDGANYLIPTEVPLAHVRDLPLMAVRLDRITAALADAGRINFVVFDACRNVALQRDGKDFGFKGFAPIREQRGLLVAYATEAGNVAVDESIYAKALAEEIVKPGLEAGQVFRSVTQRVEAATDAKQSPEFLDKRRFDFQFAAAVAPLPPNDPIAALVPGSGQSARDCAACPEMVVVQAGKFLMGTPATKEDGASFEGPVREVTIREPFAVGKFEVTVGQFKAFVKATGRQAEDGCFARSGSDWEHQPDKSWLDPGFKQTDTHPVTCVSSDDAKAFADWLSRTTGKAYRLLSEVDWEYAAKANPRTPLNTGQSIPTKQDQIFEERPGGDASTLEVGSLTVPNAFGLHDMHGSVWEWVDDCWFEGNTETTSPRKTACQDGDFRRLRGGSWQGLPPLRSANRAWFRPGKRLNLIGFRVARSVSR